MKRCEWANSNPLEMEYHDKEWGIPVHDDRLLFEMLTLESAQSGLSWATILKKRQSYLAAFDNFDIQKVAKYTDTKIAVLLQDAGIVRHKQKIIATIENAKQILNIQGEHGSFDAYIWSFVDGKPIKNAWQKLVDVPTNTPVSEAMSKDFKKRGFKFIGPTTCYAYMQAVGMVNDHLVLCYRHSQI
jgi:DNA-3-methyladenine glycosylase I